MGRETFVFNVLEPAVGALRLHKHAGHRHCVHAIAGVRCRVGQALLCGQWRDAVRLLLTPRDDCPRPEQAEACRLYLEQGDVEGSLRLMPRFLVTEPTLLQVCGLGAGCGMDPGSDSRQILHRLLCRASSSTGPTAS